MLAQGVFQVPVRTFVAAILLGRALRYFLEGFFAVKYGEAALGFLKVHGAAFVVGILGVIALLYVVMPWCFAPSRLTSSSCLVCPRQISIDDYSRGPDALKKTVCSTG